jgi:hypothetical protein
MADLAKGTTAGGLSSTLVPQQHQTRGIAGEAIALLDACYIKSDGKIWKATGAAANAAAKVRGFAAMAASVGEAVTLLEDVVVDYGTAVTCGTLYYLSGATAGGLADAASTGGTKPIAQAEANATGLATTTTRLHVWASVRD